MEFYENLKKTKNQPGFVNEYSEEVYPSWYNTFNFKSAESELKNFIINLYRGDKYRIWGFKEIRIGLESYELFVMTLNNFYELFPSVKFVFLYREDIEKQLNSGWWAENKTESRILLSNQLKYFKNFSLNNKENTYLLSMESMLSMNSNFRNLFDFIGMDIDYARIKKIIDTKMDYLENIQTD